MRRAEFAGGLIRLNTETGDRGRQRCRSLRFPEASYTGAVWPLRGRWATRNRHRRSRALHGACWSRPGARSFQLPLNRYLIFPNTAAQDRIFSSRGRLWIYTPASRNNSSYERSGALDRRRQLRRRINVNLRSDRRDPRHRTGWDHP